MAQNASDIRIAITGRVLTAPLGSAAPTDVSAAWPVAWTDHGFTDPNGVKIMPKVSSYDVKGWQSDTALRSRITERIQELQFILLQSGGLNTKLYFGGGSWAATGNYASVGVTTYTATTATDPSAAWTVNQWAGKVVTSGASTGTVVSNTATVLTVSAWIGGTPVGGAAFTIASGVAIYTPPQPGIDDFRMLGIEFQDGLITKRYVYPNAIEIAVNQLDLKNNKEASLDITMRALGDNWFTLSNDPADQPATLAA